MGQLQFNERGMGGLGILTAAREMFQKFSTIGVSYELNKPHADHPIAMMTQKLDGGRINFPDEAVSREGHKTNRGKIG